MTMSAGQNTDAPDFALQPGQEPENAPDSEPEGDAEGLYEKPAKMYIFGDIRK